MNLKVNFISKLTKTNSVNNIVFVKDNKFKNKFLNPIIKSVTDNELFKDDLFVQKEFNNSNYIFVNFKNMSTSSDCENIGSKLYDYLKKNKLENSCILFARIVDPETIDYLKLILELDLKYYF